MNLAFTLQLRVYHLPQFNNRQAGLQIDIIVFQWNLTLKMILFLIIISTIYSKNFTLCLVMTITNYHYFKEQIQIIQLACYDLLCCLPFVHRKFLYLLSYVHHPRIGRFHCLPITKD